jgi:hypothetical protein
MNSGKSATQSKHCFHDQRSAKGYGGKIAANPLLKRGTSP